MDAEEAIQTPYPDAGDIHQRRSDNHHKQFAVGSEVESIVGKSQKRYERNSADHIRNGARKQDRRREHGDGRDDGYKDGQTAHGRYRTAVYFPSPSAVDGFETHQEFYQKRRNEQTNGKGRYAGQ